MTARIRLASTWVAILAILLNALMPTLSLAFAPAQNPPGSGDGRWVEICTTQGSSWIQLSADGQVLAQTAQQPDDAPAASHNGHCPYCLTHADSFVLPSVPATLLPVWLPVANLLPRNEAPALATSAWMGPIARAPPAGI